MKTGIDLLLKCRTQVEVLPENLYLFAIPNSVNALRGSDCIRRFSIESETKRPDIITSTKLIKHVATFSQMLSLRDNELDILAKFMGHDIRVHREYYRLPENTLQVAKISKILLAMETGNITKMAGMNLDDISVDVTTTRVNLNGSKKGTCKQVRRYWTADEKRAVSEELGNNIRQMKVPGKLDCDRCLRKRTELSRRSWRDIKNYVHNVIQSKKRQ
ncbi:uncharacterized protein LOC126830572 [Patella vulgata]|uniref:uncharacterized protein LOC126830572 n=1 Tax=Patella vulgata TaxID=6465 RepID=UPI00217FD93F|nr:uncharacterized protein LOC126830572 [Patella vulgata]